MFGFQPASKMHLCRTVESYAKREAIPMAAIFDRRYLVLCWALPLTLVVAAHGREHLPVDFSRDVQPLLARHCFACHGPDEGSREAGLRLDVRLAAIAELDSGSSAVVPGRPEESELIARVAAADADVRMPPGEHSAILSPEQVNLLRRWIAAGAAYDNHWSFRPVMRPEPPAVANEAWIRNPLDRFVLARLEREGLAPSPEASRTTLLRRLSLDLTGLPPTPATVAAFDADKSPDAYDRAVNRYLASPHFGERWGRHWLDIAHYADSDGYLNDDLRPNAWRYRDWVIDAVNRDLPFDRFTIEQLAGDLLPDATESERTATGFLRNTLRNIEAGVDLEEYRNKEVVDRVSTVGAGWLGLTLGCAECHSHKYDPISHREFYQLFSFFNETDDIELPGSKAMAVGRHAEYRESFVHLRGDYRQQGELVEPGTPAILPPIATRAPRADRLDLAYWLTDPGNPLTPRVVVNRWWLHLFGSGLVASTDNFGVGGDAPTHPELLDWLAAELIDRNWSRKEMIRLIVNSATYRQSSAGTEELERRDPRNQLLARQSRLRLEAEAVRDAALVASGLLDRRIGGPGVCPPQPDYVASISRNVKWEVSQAPDLYRRGMYILFRRATPYPMLLTFDAPDSTVACTRRERSNSPLQALTLLNDPVFFECAQTLGRRLANQPERPADERIAEAVRLCVGREPHPAELQRIRALLEQQLAASASVKNAARLDPLANDSDPSADDVASAPVPANEAAWIIVARVLMNLDEFITRE